MSPGLGRAHRAVATQGEVYLTLSLMCPFQFLLCGCVSRPHLSVGISNVLISFESLDLPCYCFMSLPLEGLLSNLAHERQFSQEPLWNNDLSIAALHKLKTIKQVSEPDSSRYSSPFSAKKLIAFQT